VLDHPAPGGPVLDHPAPGGPVLDRVPAQNRTSSRNLVMISRSASLAIPQTSITRVNQLELVSRRSWAGNGQARAACSGTAAARL
jgi:hypothetical protein